MKLCYSKYGYCGTVKEFCQIDCQIKYGKCFHYTGEEIFDINENKNKISCWKTMNIVTIIMFVAKKLDTKLQKLSNMFLLFKTWIVVYQINFVV